MSAHLGFIHYWLYSKIRRVNERETMLQQKAAETCGDLAEELRQQIWGTYGEPLPEKDLAELIDPGNIHGWLQRQINVAETREAAFVQGLIDNCGDAAEQLAGEVFAEHGRICGLHAREQGKYDAASAAGIYKAFTDYFLNGMPCDQNTVLVTQSAEQTVWECSGEDKLKNWQRAGSSPAVMKKFYLAWMKGFVEGMNAGFTHRLAADAANRHEIVRI